MRKKRERKGFTLIELMVVILIVGILAAVAIPLMRGRIDAAKWSEGKAIMGTIGTAVRAYAAEMDTRGSYGIAMPSMAEMGFAPSDFTGTYFVAADFSWTTAYVVTADPPLTFTISCTPTTTTLIPATVTLDNTGTWVP